MAEELTSPLDLDYDPEGDVFYIFLGQPYPTVNYELDGNFTFRLDPKTKKLVGLTIHQYSEIFPEALREEGQPVLAGSLMRLFQQLLREKKLREPIVA